MKFAHNITCIHIGPLLYSRIKVTAITQYNIYTLTVKVINIPKDLNLRDISLLDKPIVLPITFLLVDDIDDFNTHVHDYKAFITYNNLQFVLGLVDKPDSEDFDPNIPKSALEEFLCIK